MKRSKAKIFCLHLAVFAAIGAYLFISLSFRIYCPIKYITGFSCPACGSTRAMFSLFRGDFSAYFAYNPFALPLGACLLLFPHLSVLGKFKTPALIFCIATAVISFVYNIIRIV